jgi:hypothetical protein
MPGDNTRFTFNPLEDHLGVLMQQGRVLLDADFNELVEILDRRWRSETIDIIGRGVIPRETPEGFHIQLTGGVMTIGLGRAYVDGLQAENHGKAPLEFDGHLAELRGTLPVPYLEQPYLPNAAVVAPLPAGGPHLVYLDVWERELTYLQEPDLLEKAVGVDTTTRLQTAWQVRVLANSGGGVTCATPDDKIPAWVALTTPTGGRLTTSAVGVPTSTDPCVVNPSGGYRGTENRCYRVEIHDPGPLGTATFKWSRDNGSIATAVTAINAGLDVLTVTRTARDATLRFSPGDWVEVTDDWHELAGQPGVMRKVLFVDDVAQTIQLAAALPAGAFDGATPQSRHTRVQRWDQKGIVLDAANNPVADVDASGGVIPVLAAGSLVLEDGVQVSFSFEAGGTPLRTAHYWAFAARTVDASVEILDHAPPRGVHHHYCRLAMVTFPSTAVDCRVFWPPEFGGETGCDCSVCVTPQSHNGGTLTIQKAIDQVKATGGKVCLGPGSYFLREPIVIDGAQSTAVHGHGFTTMLVYAGQGVAVLVRGSTGVDLESFSVLSLSNADNPGAAIGVLNSTFVRIEHCALFQIGPNAKLPGAAVALGGFVMQLSVRNNILVAALGVTTVATPPAAGGGAIFAAGPSYALLWDAFFDDNFMIARDTGVQFVDATLYVGQTRLAGNSIYGGQQAAIAASGFVFHELLTSSRLDVIGNQIAATGDGIVIACDNARVAGNDVGRLVTRGGAPSGHGIVISRPEIPIPVARCTVEDNRVSGCGGHGIRIHGRVGSAVIERNTIGGANRGGVVMEEVSLANRLTIRANTITDSGLVDDQGMPLAAIQLFRADDAEVSGNTIARYAVGAVSNPARVGILAVSGQRLRVSGNDLSDIGPPGPFINLGAGIAIGNSYRRVEVFDNTVRRGLQPLPPDPSRWHALLIGEATLPATPLAGHFALVPLGTKVLAVFGDLVLAFEADVMVGVHGNLLEAQGEAPTVSIAADGPCTLQDNRCALTPFTATGGPAPVAVVHVIAPTTIASANLVRRTPQLPDFLAMKLDVDNFTVVGNITAGPIFIKAAQLAGPFAPLNVIAP